MTINSGDNMDDQAIAPNNSNENEDEQGDSLAEEISLADQEYTMLDSKLDELNSALDFIEQKNSDIHQQLIDLLQSSREIREEIKKENNDSTSQGEGSAEKS